MMDKNVGVTKCCLSVESETTNGQCFGSVDNDTMLKRSNVLLKQF